MKKIWQMIKPAIICFFIFTLLCGLAYTGIVTGIAQVLFPDKANGSIIMITQKDGTAVKYGSELIAQEFSEAKYLIGRPAGTSNLSAISEEEKVLVQNRRKWLQSLDPGNQADVPLDLVTSSGSGVDPYISPKSAEYQVARIAMARGISDDKVRDIIRNYTTPKLLGIWGEEGVNVLKVNLALDGLLNSSILRGGQQYD
jgi:potassium-transporting ATPase KdpC subunit